MSDAAGSSTFYYDVMGRTSKIVRSMSGGPSLIGQFVYKLMGGLTESQWPGIWDGGTPLTIYYDYDNQGRQNSSHWSNNGGGAYQSCL